MTPGCDLQTNLADGWAALRRRDWAKARELFHSAVTGGTGPEAWEGLSWAAWWLDDAETVFAAREKAFHGYRDAEDPASAARMAIWLAADQLDFNGALATANGWLQRAQRLLDPLEAGVEHGWLAMHQGYVAVVQGDAAKAESLGIAAARLGREHHIPDLEMLGLALQGTTLVSRAEVDSGMRCLDEASAIALTDEATIPMSSAWTCCFMVTACTKVLDFERAFEWCDRIAQFAERYDSRYMLGFCRAEYATIHLWRGQWEKAEQALEEALEAFAASRPSSLSGVRVGLAELRRRQGRRDECLRLLDAVEGSTSAQLCRARLALDIGDPRGALELGERAARNAPPGRRLERVPALELVVRAQLALGELDKAAETTEQLRDTARAVGTVGLRAKVDLLEGLLQAARGRPEEAKTLLEDSLDGFSRCGAPFDAACTRLELASVLQSMGRDADAQREAAAARERLDAIGARAVASQAQPLLEAEETPAASRAKLPISRRECEVLALLAAGKTNREIAAQLFISEHTVHRHVSSILRKLGVSSRTAAAALALREGLLPPK